MRVIQVFILLLLISNFATASITCDSHYSISVEKKVQNIIQDQKIAFDTKTKKIHQVMTQTLKDRKIAYKTESIDDSEIIVIKASKTSKLGRFARYLENNYQTKLAVSFSLTGKIDAGLEMSDEGILLTSIQDILRAEIGPATRHELSHLWEATASELNIPHPVFNVNIRSRSPLFNTEYMNGYENYISYGEVHAYSRELHYSLWKLRQTKNQEMRKAIELDIKEAHSRLKEITYQLKAKTSDIQKSLKHVEVTEDDYTFYLQASDWNMSVAKYLPNLSQQLEMILNHLNKLEQKLKTTQMQDLEAVLLEYLTSLK